MSRSINLVLTGLLLIVGMLGWQPANSASEKEQSALYGAADLAEALLKKYPYLLDSAGIAALGAINRQLREDPTAESRLQELLNESQAVIRVTITGGQAQRSSRDPVELPGDVGALLFRIESGPGGTQYVTFDKNLTKKLDPSQLVEVGIGSEGITWALIGLSDMPPGLSSLDIAFQRENGNSLHMPLEVKVPQPGRLKATILSEQAAQPTPAMVRLIWRKDGSDRKPSNALEFVPQVDDYGGLDYSKGTIGPFSGRFHANLSGRLEGYYWCVPGPFDMALSPGQWEITVRRGVEWLPVFDTFTIESGKVLEKTYRLRRWVDMRQLRWYSGDDHVHAQILSDIDAEKIITWARAEDVHLVNILWVGDVHRTWFQQRGFGKEHRVRDGDYILAPGQECPRTILLGHFVGLNTTQMVRDPARYYQYDWIYDAIHEQGGLAGCAHGFVGAQGANIQRAMSLNVPRGKNDFVEVMNGRLLGTELFYDFLNLGFKVTASAGTDVPWPRTIGEARMYAFLGDQPYEADAWFEAVRRGRTFVTNGPMIELRVDGAVPGDEIVFKTSRRLRVRARAWGDPGYPGSIPRKLEVVCQGDVVRTMETSQPGEREAVLDFTVEAGPGFWIAARASGDYGTWAHTTPVYVIRKGLRFWKHEAVSDLVAKRLVDLKEIEQFVLDGNDPISKDKVPGDSLERQQLITQGPVLLQRVEEARRIYQSLLQTAEREHSVRGNANRRLQGG